MGVFQSWGQGMIAQGLGFSGLGSYRFCSWRVVIKIWGLTLKTTRSLKGACFLNQGCSYALRSGSGGVKI